jgi:hypothetical protein
MEVAVIAGLPAEGYVDVYAGHRVGKAKVGIRRPEPF